MADKVIGTCSLCGGPVTVMVGDSHMMLAPGFISPQECKRCGAIAQHGPVIHMILPKKENGGT